MSPLTSLSTNAPVRPHTICHTYSSLLDYCIFARIPEFAKCSGESEQCAERGVGECREVCGVWRDKCGVWGSGGRSAGCGGVQGGVWRSAGRSVEECREKCRVWRSAGRSECVVGRWMSCLPSVVISAPDGCSASHHWAMFGNLSRRSCFIAFK